jgi:hypothetical protein
MNRKHVDKPHKSITTEQVAKLTNTLTRADVEGFAKTLDALRASDLIPEGLKINLAEAFDKLAELDEAGETDILAPSLITVWLPRLLNVSEPMSEDSPLFPVTGELRRALDADAKRCCRTPHNQVIAILETHFGLNDCSLKFGNKERAGGGR